jgi:hypothetical protein
MQQMQQAIQALADENKKLQLEVKNKESEIAVKAFDAETKRMDVENKLKEAMADAQFKAADFIVRTKDQDKEKEEPELNKEPEIKKSKAVKQADGSWLIESGNKKSHALKKPDGSWHVQTIENEIGEDNGNSI